MARRRPASPSGFCGSRVLWVGFVGGAVGLTLGLFLRTIVARTPTQLPSYALYWLTLVLGVMGILSGMAVEAVRQLQSGNPDPAYHRGRQQQQRQAEEGDDRGSAG